jgi:GH24 family phage-related lysozyme (muramidase)
MNQQTKTIIIVAAIALILTIAPMTVSAAENLIINFEGKYLNAYDDGTGKITIGYGSIYNYDENRPVRKGDVITEDTAIRWLRKEMSSVIADVKKVVTVPINQNQLDSLTSFTYNLGIGNLKSSTLLRLLNAGADKQTVANQFQYWNKAMINGKLTVMNGLTTRRKAEADLFIK